MRRYVDSVPNDFCFTIKAPNAITLTHSYAKQPKGSEHSANEPNPYFLSVDLLNRFLETTTDIIRQNLDADVDTYVNVNNHYEGCAPLTIRRLLDILQRATSGLPKRAS